MQSIAVGSLYGSPHPVLLQASLGTYFSVQHFKNTKVIAFDIKAIRSVVMMAPDRQYPFHDGTEGQRYYLMERPGLKVLSLLGVDEENLQLNNE